MKTFQMHSPVFGQCWLRPHTMDEVPCKDVLIGYIEEKARPGTLTVAIYRLGEWRTRGLKPFKSPVVGWWSVEKEDGSPVL